MGTMEWDLGLQGLGLLVAMGLGFGPVAQLVAGRTTTRWLWLIAAAAYVLAGILVSEWWFGWATEEELQPNIDGLSFDEVFLIVTLPLLVALLVVRRVSRRAGRR